MITFKKISFNDKMNKDILFDIDEPYKLTAQNVNEIKSVINENGEQFEKESKRVNKLVGDYVSFHNYIGIYESSKTYQEGNVVIFNETFWKAKQETFNNEPSESDYWTEIKRVDMKDLEGLNDEIKKEFEQHLSDLNDKVEGEMTTLETTLTNKIDQNDTNIKQELNEAKRELGDRITTNQSQISQDKQELTNLINTNTQSIQTHNQEYNALKQNLETFKSKIEALKIVNITSNYDPGQRYKVGDIVTKSSKYFMSLFNDNQIDPEQDSPPVKWFYLGGPTDIKNLTDLVNELQTNLAQLEQVQQSNTGKITQNEQSLATQQILLTKIEQNVNALNSYLNDNYFIKFDGEYQPRTYYRIGTIVFYQGKTYICIKNTLGNLPTDTTYWFQKDLVANVPLDDYYKKGEIDGKLSLYATLEALQREFDKSVKLTGDQTITGNKKFHGEVEFGTVLKAGYGGGVLHIIPEDTSQKTLKFGNSPNNNTQRFTTIDLENRTCIKNMPIPVEDSDGASKWYVDIHVNDKITSPQLDTRLSNYVKLSGDQTIVANNNLTGRNRFTNQNTTFDYVVQDSDNGKTIVNKEYVDKKTSQTRKKQLYAFANEYKMFQGPTQWNTVKADLCRDDGTPLQTSDYVVLSSDYALVTGEQARTLGDNYITSSMIPRMNTDQNGEHSHTPRWPRELGGGNTYTNGIDIWYKNHGGVGAFNNEMVRAQATDGYRERTQFYISNSGMHTHSFGNSNPSPLNIKRFEVYTIKFTRKIYIR